MLKASYLELISNYTNDKQVASKYWDEIVHNYSGSQRHYHTLEHLENMLLQLLPIKEKIESWKTVMFSLYYHDIIYNSLKSNNEEKSAELAVKRMQELKVQADVISECKAQIITTKAHQSSNNSDTNYFTDVDLSILGQDWTIYKGYCQNIRKEYSVYPNFMYNRGRKKVIQHFLNMDRIYKTDYYYGKLERSAKDNLMRELEDFKK